MSKEDRIELLRDFIKEMKKQGYSAFYIGEQIALVVKAIDTLKD